MSWLRRVRSRSRSYRQSLAFFIALMVTAGVTGLWLVSLPERFAALSGAAPVIVERDPYWQSMFAGVRTQLAGVQNAFLEIQPTSTSTNTTTIAPPAASAPTTNSTTTPAIMIPTISPETVREVKPRIIQIATTSTPQQ